MSSPPISETTEPKGKEAKPVHKRIARNRNLFEKYGMFTVLLVIFAACSIVSPYFLQVKNLLNVSRRFLSSASSALV